jgi:hypothetical protein
LKIEWIDALRANLAIRAMLLAKHGGRRVAAERERLVQKISDLEADLAYVEGEATFHSGSGKVGKDPLPEPLARSKKRLPPAKPSWRGLMPRGPKGEKRPADTVAAAIMVAKIATGEIEEKLKEPFGKVRSGKAEAAARANKLTAEERSAIAKKAAGSRWR